MMIIEYDITRRTGAHHLNICPSDIENIATIEKSAYRMPFDINF